MTTPTRYPEIEVSGSPREMGRQIGEAAGEWIRDFAGIALDRVNKTVPISRKKALEMATASFRHVEAYSPDMLEELHGMAESSGIPPAELMLLQIRNQLQPDEDAGCTSFSAVTEPSPASPAVGDSSLVGQNWDNDPALDPMTIVLTRRPENKPALMNVTQAGLIGYIGLNDRGIGICMNTLPAPSRPLGVPFYFIVRGIYEADSLDGAVNAAGRAERAIAGNLMLATPQGPADLEITLDEVRVLTGDGSGLVTHTNHCLHPDLLAINDEFPELIESRPRKRRVDQLFSDLDSRTDVESLKDVLRDHDNHPKSICRHENDHPQNGFWTTVFSIIMEADAGRVHVCRGNPCQRPYETYQLR